MEEKEKVETATTIQETAGTETKGDTTLNVENKSGFDEVTDKDFEEKKEESVIEEKPTEEQKDKVEKTYTQKEMESVIEKRIDRLVARHKKEITELEERYKKGDYSPELVELQGKLDLSNKKVIELQGQIARFEIDNAFLKTNILDEYRDYVEYKVLRMVDENNNFTKCLEEFKKTGENLKYFKNTTGGGSVVPPRPTNSSASAEAIAGESALKKAMGI